ncbi:MAG: hypothetical protein AB7E70_09690, partial [Hyphomicrobiaceae bacterium]
EIIPRSRADARTGDHVHRDTGGVKIARRSPHNRGQNCMPVHIKAEIDEDAWATLYRDISRPFPRPSNGRFAVKVINHFGDEVMKVFAV